MVGIYKITNKVNNKVYIGQSVDVKRRWRQHKSCSLKYHLYESFRKYGLNNFIFEVVTECKVSQLDELETYYIDLYDSTNPEKGYNQTIRSAGSHGIIFTYDTLQNLYEDLYDGLLTKRQLAEKYNCNERTIRDINNGKTWFQETISYPIRAYFIGKDNKYYHNYCSKEIFYCNQCGKQLKSKSNICPQCFHKNSRKVNWPNKDELINLLKNFHY